jgi:hypothetical protein
LEKHKPSCGSIEMSVQEPCRSSYATTRWSSSVSRAAADVEASLKKAMIEGMDAVVNGADEVDVPVDIEVRIAGGWGEGPSGSSPRDIF